MRILKVAMLAGAALLAVNSTANAQIRIATAGPMTGQYASFGEQMRRGAEMAIKDINAAFCPAASRTA